jgi:hypothetical protein
MPGNGWRPAGLARVAISEGELQRAGRLTEAADALSATVSAPRPAGLSAEYAHDMVAGHTELTRGAWQAAWDEGRVMTLEQAIAYALGEDAQTL